ncbi:MAG: hypothetical protein K0Q72_1312 [Armatimonadetes bacterium]|nr:hypothetical protein [Armatimonadota bacterium]
MSESLTDALSGSGPHTAESLAERLPHFPFEAICDSLELLVAQGVLRRTVREDGTPEYTYAAPDRYAQHNWDVIKNPGKRHQGVEPR